MSPVAVVTDTTHYLPSELTTAAGIHQVSLWVNDGETHVRESDMPDYHAYYERLRRSETMPTTSQPSIGDFLAVYEPLVQQGCDIVSVHLAGGVSGTVESARQAAAEAVGSGQRRIEVIDSNTAAAGLGVVALAAATVANAGGDIDAVTARANLAAANVKIWFAVDTLEYLRRGGRIGSAQAWLGGALKIKPILTCEHEITPIERVRTSGRAFERLAAYLQARMDDGADAWLVQHIEAHDQAEAMVERGREIFGTDPVAVSQVGPVIGTYVGPGLLGVCAAPSSLMR